MNDQDYLKLAIEESARPKGSGNLAFGAVVVCQGKVVGRGRNMVDQKRDVTAHAELTAVREACRTLGRVDLSDCAIYASVEPCNMCASAIFQAKISRIVIGANRADLPNVLRQRKIGIDALAEDSGYHPEIVKGVLKEKVIRLFADYKARR